MRARNTRRRAMLRAVTSGVAMAAAVFAATPVALAQGASTGARVRVGMMLPYSGTFALLGVAIENGFRLALREQGGRLGGREVDIVKVDDESDPAKATDNIHRLLTREKVDVVLGTVHSGVAEAMVRVTREAGTLHIIPNAGLASVAGPLCAPNIFRTSFSNWQSGYAMGVEMAKRERVKNVATIAWRYAAGEESVKGFKEGFAKGGGKISRELWIPFPEVEFQVLLTEIAAARPDATYAFFAGAGAARFLKGYDQAGLKKTIPLVGPGFLTDGVLDAVGSAAEGVETTLHYGDGLETPKSKAFRLAYARMFRMQPDVYAVAGYDSAYLLAAGLKAAGGDMARRKEMIAAMEKASIDSPRGRWKLSRAHNPIQDHYLRKVVGTENRVTGIAVRQLDDDPAMMAACRMGK